MFLMDSCRAFKTFLKDSYNTPSQNDLSCLQILQSIQNILDGFLEFSQNNLSLRRTSPNKIQSLNILIKLESNAKQ